LLYVYNFCFLKYLCTPMYHYSYLVSKYFVNLSDLFIYASWLAYLVVLLTNQRSAFFVHTLIVIKATVFMLFINFFSGRLFYSLPLASQCVGSYLIGCWPSPTANRIRAEKLTNHTPLFSITDIVINVGIIFIFTASILLTAKVRGYANFVHMTNHCSRDHDIIICIW